MITINKNMNLKKRLGKPSYPYLLQSCLTVLNKYDNTSQQLKFFESQVKYALYIFDFIPVFCNSVFNIFYLGAHLSLPHVRVAGRRRCNPCRPHTRRTKASTTFFRHGSRTNHISRCVFVELWDFWVYYSFKNKFLLLPVWWLTFFKILIQKWCRNFCK